VRRLAAALKAAACCRHGKRCQGTALQRCPRRRQRCPACGRRL